MSLHSSLSARLVPSLTPHTHDTHHRTRTTRTRTHHRCILLKQAQQPPRQVEKVVQSLPSVLIFMDKFVEDSPFVTQEVLEACLPYALLRSMYKQLYDTKTQGKKGNYRTQHTTRHARARTHTLIGGLQARLCWLRAEALASRPRTTCKRAAGSAWHAPTSHLPQTLCTRQSLCHHHHHHHHPPSRSFLPPQTATTTHHNAFISQLKRRRGLY